MKRLTRFTFLLLWTITFSSFGQRLVTGRLIDKETGKAIKNATITLVGTNTETTVNALGFFQLQIDSVDQITIKSPDYAIMEVRIPNANSFKIELVKPTDPFSNFIDEETQRIYLDDYGFPSDKVNAKSYRIVNQHPAEPSKVLVKDYYTNQITKQTGTYSDKEIYTRDGFFTLFYTNGQKNEEGFFKDNLQIGHWTKWYKNGQIQEESFHDNSKEFNQRLTVYNFWDSLGTKLVTNGNGEYIIDDDSPIICARGSIKGGLKNGKWFGYFKNGEIAYEEEYENNNLVQGLSYDSLRKEYKYDKVSDYDLKSFYEFIGKSLKYPATARQNSIQGKVIVHIVFDFEGKILKSRIAKGMGSGCDEEALRVVNKYDGKWRSGKERGQPLTISKPQSMYLPIMFKLG